LKWYCSTRLIGPLNSPVCNAELITSKEWDGGRAPNGRIRAHFDGIKRHLHSHALNLIIRIKINVYISTLVAKLVAKFSSNFCSISLLTPIVKKCVLKKTKKTEQGNVLLVYLRRTNFQLNSVFHAASAKKN
jgi:hypothetical protein